MKSRQTRSDAERVQAKSDPSEGNLARIRVPVQGAEPGETRRVLEGGPSSDLATVLPTTNQRKQFTDENNENRATDVATDLVVGGVDLRSAERSE